MINPLDLTGRTILVTGASSGIGSETAILLSKLGARVVLTARKEKGLTKTLALLDSDKHLIAPFELTDFDSIPAFLKEVSIKTNGLDGLVHCAGIQSTIPLRFLKKSDLHKLFSINVDSAFALIKGFRQKGVCRPNSSIVLLASVIGMVGQAGLSMYGASKGAIIALTKSAAIELAKDTIRINCIAPALVQTEMIENAHNKLTAEQLTKVAQKSPLGIGRPRDVANSIAFLLADTARWITGTTLVVDGGYTAQ